MPNRHPKLQAGLLGLALLLATLLVVPGALAQDSELYSLKNRWEHITTQTAEEDRAKAFESLAGEAASLAEQYPDNAKVLIWQGIVLASQARAEGGLAALGLAKEARVILEKAIELDPHGNNGSAFVTLGALYDRAPGWPIAFGDSDTAEQMFQRALEIRPDGIDVNYYYASFLEDEGHETQALEHARRAVKGEARDGRKASDEALREDAEALVAALQ